jgi:hypothetical protein
VGAGFLTIIAFTNHYSISPDTYQDLCFQKIPEVAIVGEILKKREPMNTIGWNGNWCSHLGKQWKLVKKLKIK